MQGNTVFYLAASQTALGGHKTYFYVYHNMPIEASTNSFKTPIFKGYSGCVLFGIIGSVKSYAQKSKQAAKEKSRYAMEESPRATSRCFMFMYFLLPH